MEDPESEMITAMEAAGIPKPSDRLGDLLERYESDEWSAFRMQIAEQAISDKNATQNKNTAGKYGAGDRKFVHFCMFDTKGERRPGDPYLDSNGRPISLASEQGVTIAAAYLLFLSNNMPGAPKAIKREAIVSYDTIRSCLSSLQWRYSEDLIRLNDQEAAARLPKQLLKDDALYKQIWKNKQKDLQEARKRHEDGRDPQKDTSSKYLSEDELLAFIVSLVLPPASGNDTNYKAERRAMLAAKSTLTYATASRGGETTELRWSELMAPELNAHLGPCPFFSVTLPVISSKQQADLSTTYVSVGRSYNPIMDPFRAMGEYAVLIFTLLKTMRFPDPREGDQWRKAKMFAGGKSPNIPMSKEAEHKALDSVLRDTMGFNPTATRHLFHGQAANDMNQQGLINSELKTIWEGKKEVINKNYLGPNQPLSLMAAGWWPGVAERDFSKIFHPRMCQNVPESLIRKLAPWLIELEERVRSMGDTAEESHKAVPQSLRFIMIVLVQDSLELAEKINTRVHKWLLQQQEFQDMLKLYKQQVRTGFWDWLNKPENKHFKHPVAEEEGSAKFSPEHAASVAQGVLIDEILEMAKQRRVDVKIAKEDYQQKEHLKGTTKVDQRKAPLPAFGAYKWDMAHDVNGKMYMVYLSHFSEPTHYHARYPFRHFLSVFKLSSAPHPPGLRSERTYTLPCALPSTTPTQRSKRSNLQRASPPLLSPRVALATAPIVAGLRSPLSTGDDAALPCSHTPVLDAAGKTIFCGLSYQAADASLLWDCRMPPPAKQAGS